MRAADFTADDALKAVDQLLLDHQQHAGLFLNVGGQILDLAAQRPQRPPGQAAHALIQGALIQLRKRFGREIGVVRRRGEREVHLCCALPQQRGRFEIGIAQFPSQRRQRVCRRGDEAASRPVGGRERSVSPRRQNPVEKPVDVLQRITPGVAFIPHERLQDADRRNLSGLVVIIHGTRDQRGMTEARRLGEKPTDFQVGIHPLVQPPKQFQQQSIAINDRAIALLHLERAHRQLIVGRSASAR